MNPFLKILIALGFLAFCILLGLFVAIAYPSLGEREEDRR